MPTTSKLLEPIQFLKGVGPARAETLAKLGLKTIADVLFFFPRDYEDLTQVSRISDFEEGKTVTTVCRVEDMASRMSGGGKLIVTIVFTDGTGHIRATWFNQPFVMDAYKLDDRVIVSGKAKYAPLNWEMTHPRVRRLNVSDSDNSSDASLASPGVLPIYRLTEGVNQRQMRHVAQSALETAEAELKEALPEALRATHGLMDIQQALRNIHFPPTIEARDAARRRFVFQELLVMQLALAMRRHDITANRRAIALETSSRIDARIRRLLPFELTEDQNNVIAEITSDLANDIPMNRLLQGDVGSGKTIVAVYAMLVAVAHGHQSILMAPTEVLAQQHYQNLTNMLSHGRVRVALWTGTIKGKAREALAKEIAAGEYDIVVGTQAIVQSKLELPSIALVIIDEQHRFGVKMRAQLRATGIDPHYLVMTATPIPRTVAMVEFGDLETSELRSFPPNRQEVHTYWVEEDKRESFWDFFREQLNAGRQGIVITPMVEDKSASKLTSVQEAFEALVNGELEAYRCDLVHGQLPADEKLSAMDKFRSGETQVLVATSIVEVGIDVANLSVMVIENAERFGLAALHQLRGRVGRGKHAGYVAVFADPTTDEGRQRLEAFVSTRDGFDLAERDFELRGPGDLFGTRQHGLPPLRIADLQADSELLEEVRTVAREMIDQDPELANEALSELRRQAQARYGSVLDLGDVG